MPSDVMADINVQAEQKYILVTGFEPFGGRKSDGSWEAVQHLDGAVITDMTLPINIINYTDVIYK